MTNILIGKNMSKLTEIPILNKITKLHDVVDFVRVSDFVFNTICHAKDSGIDIDYSVNQLYWQFVNKKKFGWCYMHSLYYHLILQEYGQESYIYDYGLPVPQLTHTVVIITLRDEKFLIDPYFNRHYVNERGNPLPFQKLLKLIEKDPSKIYSRYGPSMKEVKQGDKFIKTTPSDFEKGVLDAWKVNQEYDERMMKNFNNLNPLFLILRKVQKGVVHKKLDGTKYYDFY